MPVGVRKEGNGMDFVGICRAIFILFFALFSGERNFHRKGKRKKDEVISEWFV